MPTMKKKYMWQSGWKATLDGWSPERYSDDSQAVTRAISKKAREEKTANAEGGPVLGPNYILQSEG